jgi:hypothetical protein
MTQVTIELPDQLAEQLNTYLQTHPEETIVGLIHEALKIKLLPKDSSKLLELAGIVTDTPTPDEETIDPEAWDVWRSLGDDAVEGKLENPSINHDRYLYQQPK